MKSNKPSYRESCPNCQCFWGVEENDWNKCNSCGWPDNDNKEQIKKYPCPDCYATGEQEVDGYIDSCVCDIYIYL
jgi:predicted RNA-binding Zn-ribbon protein involved in translation (DUF1610 family)